MTPKEKAKELVDRFKADTVIYTWDGNGYKVDIETSFQNAKNCALICVDEILNSNPTIITEEIIEHIGYKEIIEHIGYKETVEKNVDYWQEVKQEIKKL